MSEQLKFYKGLESKLPAAEDIQIGALYHCIDTNNTYLGVYEPFVEVPFVKYNTSSYDSRIESWGFSTAASLGLLTAGTVYKVYQSNYYALSSKEYILVNLITDKENFNNLKENTYYYCTDEQKVYKTTDLLPGYELYSSASGKRQLGGGTSYDAGDAKGIASFAGGSTNENLASAILGFDITDDSLISGILNGQLSNAEKRLKDKMGTPPKASGEVSLSYGSANESISALSTTLGLGSTAGAKGFYIRSITLDGTNLIIYLNEVQGSSAAVSDNNLTVSLSSDNQKWTSTGQNELTKLSNKLSILGEASIILKKPHIHIGKINEINVGEGKVVISNNNNKISLSDLQDAADASSLITLPYNFSFYVPSMPEVGLTNIHFAGLATGLGNSAAGTLSQAHGKMNTAAGQFSFAVGQDNVTGYGAFASGENNRALGYNSLVFGNQVRAFGSASSAGGYKTTAYGENAHIEGNSLILINATKSTDDKDITPPELKANSIFDTWESRDATTSKFAVAYGDYSHVEGQNNIALGSRGHAEGWMTAAASMATHASGRETIAGYPSGKSFSIDPTKYSSSTASEITEARIYFSTPDEYALYDNCIPGNLVLVGEIYSDTVVGEGENASIKIELYDNKDSKLSTTTIPLETTRTEDLDNGETGYYGNVNVKISLPGNISYFKIVGNSHCVSLTIITFEIVTTTLSGCYATATGYKTKALGNNSFAEGQGTIAHGINQHVQGKYNKEDKKQKYAVIVGNGTGTSNRSNAYALDWNGNVEFAGGAKFGGGARFEENIKHGGVYYLGPYNNYSNGYLINIGPSSTNLKVVLKVTGHGYGTISKSNMPINSIFQFYNYQQQIVRPSGLTLGENIGDLKVYNFNGRLYAYLPYVSTDRVYYFELLTNRTTLTPSVADQGVEETVTTTTTITPKPAQPTILAGTNIKLTKDNGKNEIVIAVDGLGDLAKQDLNNILSNENALANAATASAGSKNIAARADHIHPLQESVSGSAGSVKNKLTLTLNNGTPIEYDGSAAKTINITPSSIGAANATHTHEEYVNQNAFANVAYGSTTISATNPSDTLTIAKDGIISYTLSGKTLTIGTTNVKVGTGTNALILNRGLYATGEGALSTGLSTQAIGRSSMANGVQTEARNQGAATFGYGTRSAASWQFIIGEYNEIDSAPRFIIGDGTADSRLTTFKISPEGHTTTKGWIEADGQICSKKGLYIGNSATGTPIFQINSNGQIILPKTKSYGSLSERPTNPTPGQIYFVRVEEN